MYQKLDEIIMEACQILIKRNEPIFKSYGLESSTEGRDVVRKTQRIYRERFGDEPSKMTVWRHIHKLVEDGNLLLEMKPPILLKVAHIRLPP